MPRLTIASLARQRRPAGETKAPLVTVAAGHLRATMQLNPLVQDFDDPTLRVTLMVRVSADSGLTFPVAVTANIVGGARAKDGSFPFVQPPLSMTVGGVVTRFNRAEVSVILNKSSRIGIDTHLDT